MEKIKNFLLKNTSTRQTIAKNTLWLFIGEGGVRVLKLALFVYTARKLGTSEWGVFSYSLALLSSFSVLSDIGVNSLLTREASRGRENLSSYISSSFFLKSGLAALASMCLLSLFFFTSKEAAFRMLIPITAFILFFDNLREFGFYLNRAFEKMETEALTKIVSAALLVAVGFLLISRHPVALSVSYAYAISAVAGAAMMYGMLRHHFKNILVNLNTKLFPYILKESWPIAVAGLIGTLVSNVDVIILGWFTDSHHIGIYSAAQKPVQIIYLIPSLLSTSFFPALSRLASDNREKVWYLVKKTLVFSFAAGILANIAIFIVGDPIFTFVLGPQYADSIPLFKIMSLAIILGAPSAIIGNVFFAVGKQKKLIHFILLTLVADVILCLLLIPRMGIYGAAISVTCAQILGNIFLFASIKKAIHDK